jgi:Transglycosylase
MKLRRCFVFTAVLLAVLASIAAALAAVAWNSLAAREAAWSHPVRFTIAGHPFEQDVSMAVLLRAATHPLAARLIDGRSVSTAQGRWHLSARSDGSVAARCEPCRFSLPALGPQPLAVERAELVLHNDGADRYRGTLQLGKQRTITLAGRGEFNRAGELRIDARLAPTPMADAVQVLGSDLPERDTVQIRGTLALALSAKTQRGPWRIEPAIDGFEVSGLGTERLADMQRPAACRVDAQRSVPTVSGWLPRAVIAAEDARFFEHPGYDLQALTDALQHNQKSGAAIAGASTLTQQLAKMVVAGDERSASRKLRELLYAVEMERTLGKARILQLYLALAPWGDGVCGAERAVRVHLGQRDASAVGPVAAAWLASLLPAPDAYLKSELAAVEVDQARVARVIDAMRPMSPERRGKAQVALLFWSPPALARLREATPPSPEALPGVSAAPANPAAETPPVAPSP